ncbi:glycosyltransferase 87 family protein [Streptomyces acidiscabies]|uniref:Membrane protein n=1 Tax=Streptomyces acidiscabies TaxID=42234 RepID=A0A0L0KLF1_9ACTN|nr:glycosyltransferase 87 family protein [Streptomyces acidiscabies]KND38651.1 membrane protein [Streptomyces acidiscabies]
MPDARRPLTGLLVTWGVTRLFLLLSVYRILPFPGPDVTTDVSVIYRSWYEILRTGTFPLHDVTWQYPPAAALPLLAPALLPFLDYASAFFLLAFAADLAVLTLLLNAAHRPGRTRRGVWVWVAGVPLLGPTAYARYDILVTAVAVAALVAGARRPRVMGALISLGALLKVWPALLLAGVARRRTWLAATLTTALLLAASAFVPGAFTFVTSQRDRGTEVESLGALVFHVARHFGWPGEVHFVYGSLEFTGPGVKAVSTAALFLTSVAFGWLLMWRLMARRYSLHTPADAAFTAVLLFTLSSRVISPQYLVWLIGTAAVCLCFRGSRMGLPAVLVLVAAGVTVIEFPIRFDDVVDSTPLGVALLLVRNGLLVTAALTACARLWRSTSARPKPLPLPAQPTRAKVPS